MAISLEILGKRLKNAREKKGYKQAYIAEVVNLSSNQISRIENGARSIYIDTLGKWCDLLEISIVEVLAEAETTTCPAYGRVFDEIAQSHDEETVVDMLNTCRTMAKIASRVKGKNVLEKP